MPQGYILLLRAILGLALSYYCLFLRFSYLPHKIGEGIVFIFQYLKVGYPANVPCYNPLPILKPSRYYVLRKPLLS